MRVPAGKINASQFSVTTTGSRPSDFTVNPFSFPMIKKNASFLLSSDGNPSYSGTL